VAHNLKIATTLVTYDDIFWEKLVLAVDDSTNSQNTANQLSGSKTQRLNINTKTHHLT
jgi:hypothetical protein